MHVPTVDISRLKGELQTAIAEREGASQETIPEYLCLNNLRSKLGRLEAIERNLAIEKYRLVFIGTIGEGKTTAICHMFNLVGEFAVQKTMAGKPRTVTESQELLATGSGRTTICEVVIEAGGQTAIVVEPYDAGEMERMIQDFCDGLAEAAGPGERKGMLSREVETAIRNVVGLPVSTVTSTDGEKSTTRVDRAREELERLGVDGLKALAVRNANLAARTQTAIEYEGTEDERVWIKRTFAKVNRGELPAVAIPRQIRVRVSPAVLAGSPLDRFRAVVDTKGIDENPIRKDLEAYAVQEDVICLFVTSFKDAPEANVRELMRFYLSSKSRDFHHRFVTLVLPHKGEPEKTNGSDGTWTTGITIKGEEIQAAFGNLGLEFFRENVLFYDALRFYRADANVLDTAVYTPEDVTEDRLACLNAITAVIDRRQQKLWEEAAGIESGFRRVLDGETLSATEVKALEAAVVKISGLRDLKARVPSFVYEEVLDRYVGHYRECYPAWNTKHAINRRFGTYEAKDYDIFYDARVVAQGESDEDTLRKFTREARIEVERVLRELGETNDALAVFVPELLEQFESSYDEYVARVGGEVEEFLRKKLSPLAATSPFWTALINEKGKQRSKGETYTDNVCLTLRREIESAEGLHTFLEQRASAGWAVLVDEVLSYFGEPRS